MIPRPVEGVDYHIAIDSGSIGIVVGTEVEVDAVTGRLFDRKVWLQAKLLELGLNDNGEPLRPYEKPRPAGERTLFDFREVHADDEL